MDQGILALEANGSSSFRQSLQRQEGKLWLPIPQVHSGGLSEYSRKYLQHKRDSTNQILKGVMAINSNALAEIRVPESYLDSLPKDIQSLCKDEDDDLPRQPVSPAAASSLPRSPSVFHRVRYYAAAGSHHHSSLALRQASSLLTAAAAKLPKNPDKPAIVYFTSFRVVQKAFEDCRKVRSILLGYRVPIDERDLSMNSRYVAELREILGVGGRKGLALPCVFVGVGGEEKVRRLHESGELRAMIDGVQPSPSTPGKAAKGRVCAGLRYTVCEECDGSRKVYVDKSGYRSCKACNVNGLTTCSRCMGL